MNNNPLIKVSLKWGLIYAGVLSLSLFGGYIFGSMTNKTLGVIIGLISFAISITVLVLSNREYQKQYLGGYIKYWQCLVNSLLVFTFSAVIIALLTYIIYGIVDVAAFNKMIDDQLLAISSNPDIPQAWKEKQLDALASMTPFKQATMQLVGSVIYGIVLSLIVSIFTRKKDKSFEGLIKEVE